jgi:nucleoside-diphosphate-sugar epimerase
MIVAVTGGLGFIGSALVEAFVAREHSVLVVDSGRASVVEDPRELGATEVLISDAATWASALERGEWPAVPDLIVHAAAPVGSAGVIEYRGTIVWEIARLTWALARAALVQEIPLLNISSSEVYGRSGVYRESDPLQVPMRPSARLEYAIGKIAGEAIVMNLAAAGRLRALSIRPFNVAGPRQDRSKGFVLPTFAEQALAGEPLTVFGNGEQQRAFTAVSDLAELITGGYLEEAPWAGEIFNAAAPENRTSILGLARKVIALAGSSSEVAFTSGREVFGPLYEEAEGFHKLPVCAEAQALGWRPALSLDDLIGQTLRFYQERRARH